jgi:hypothetical protein
MRKTPDQDLTSVEMEKLEDSKVVELCNKSGDHKLLCWPQSSRASKEDQKNAKFKECALRVQLKIVSNMVVATMRKVEILEDQLAFQLFIMPKELITTFKSREYLLLWRCEELERLRHRMGTLHTSRDAAVIDTNKLQLHH